MAITNSSLFRSTDGGIAATTAATGRCSGTAGDGIGLLNLLLLTGYNWQEVTPANLTQTGNVATLSLTSHGFNADQRLWLIGTDQIGYLNGTTYGDALYPLTVPGTGSLTFTVTGSPTSPATAAGSTTANGAISSTTATSITLTSGASFPNFPYVIKIDSEYMLVTAGFQTTTPTVRRGMFGSTAATHLTAAAVTQKILIGVAPAGGSSPWTADFTATNKSTYRPPGGNRLWMDVDDTTTTYFGVRGYETMSAAGTGTGAFPTTTQQATYNLVAVTKSSAASTAARSWVALATDRMLCLITDVSSASSTFSAGTGQLLFCDLISQTKTGDAYATLLVTEGSSANTGSVQSLSLCSSTTSSNHYMPRSYTQLGTAFNCAKYPMDGRVAQSHTLGSAGLTYPHPPDGGLYVAPLGVNEGTAAIHRGLIPGLYDILHAKPAVHGDTWTGTGSFAGKRFLAVNLYTSNQMAWEIGNTIQAT